ncbi:helix-turn-helix domain-containing protein [Parasphingorhabdus sp.]|uniref:helix-turn-helix domain-containing protein n=2 Tax=Parasphingorhabdus sp. TaxID=2709688 RepID=UPI003262DC0E
MMKPATMTIQMACEYTGLSSSMIYNLINAQRLETRKVGRRTLIVTASIDALLDIDQLEAA